MQKVIDIVTKENIDMGNFLNYPSEDVSISQYISLSDSTLKYKPSYNPVLAKRTVF